ncbi:hypothetical protein LguiA_029579 [Lonicera macranthoides]
MQINFVRAQRVRYKGRRVFSEMFYYKMAMTLLRLITIPISSNSMILAARKLCIILLGDWIRPSCGANSLKNYECRPFVGSKIMVNCCAFVKILGFVKAVSEVTLVGINTQQRLG